tara:strand:+ start:688 stop:924 length:237 start_codon:yes stop_codon:yes gene_type:complete
MNQTIAQQRVLHDYALPEKQMLLNAQMPRRNLHASKLQQAIDWLGKRYVCHPVNRVKKLTEPLPEVWEWKPRVLRKVK